MGGPSNSGGGNGGDNRTKFGYTKPKSKLKKFVQGGGVIGHIFSETIGKAAAKSNLKRRQKFISKYNTNVPPSEKINLTDEQILSKDGLSSLKGKGYTTISDRLVTGEKGNNNNQSDAKPILEASIPEQGMNEEVVTEPLETSSEYNLTDEEIALRNKRKGRKKTVLTSVTGDTSKATLGKKTLLGG